MTLKTFNKKEDFIDETLKFITKINPENIALSGGNTPRPIYEALSKTQIAEANFFQVDERYVPHDHPASNQKMIEETLKPERFHNFDTSIMIDESLEKYANEIPNQFQLTILGIGADGHTASLFPKSEALHETIQPTAHTETKKFDIKDRLTLTFPPIMNSKYLLVLLHGKEKEGILKKLQDPEISFEDFPAKKLLEHKNLNIHFCTC